MRRFARKGTIGKAGSEDSYSGLAKAFLSHLRSQIPHRRRRLLAPYHRLLPHLHLHRSHSCCLYLCLGFHPVYLHLANFYH